MDGWFLDGVLGGVMMDVGGACGRVLEVYWIWCRMGCWMGC